MTSTKDATTGQEIDRMTPRQLIEWGLVRILTDRHDISEGTVIATSVDDCVLVKDAFGQAWFYAGEVEAVSRG